MWFLANGSCNGVGLNRALGMCVRQPTIGAESFGQFDASRLQPCRLDDFIDDAECERAIGVEQIGLKRGPPHLAIGQCQPR